MNSTIEIRKKQLESLDQFLATSKNELNSLLNSFGWSMDKITGEKNLVSCPLENSHKVPEEKIGEHVKKCKMKSAGYDLSEKFLSEYVNNDENGRIKLEPSKKIEILSQAVLQNPYFQTAWNGQDPDPQTYSRLVTTYSKDERLVLYDYCVNNTKGPTQPPEFNITSVVHNEGNEIYSEKDLLSLERDLKRKSVKYKPIHTSHKDYKEILKEVIDSQMQQYVEWLGDKKSTKGPHTPEYTRNEGINELGNEHKYYELFERPHSSTSKISSHSSRSHDRKHESSHNKKSPHRSRNNSYEREKYHRFKKEDTISNHSSHSSSIKYEYIHDSDFPESKYVSSKITKPYKYKNSHKPYEKYEDLSDSNYSYNYEEKKHKKYKEYERHHKSRGYSQDIIKSKHHRHRSRSHHRSEEHKSYSSKILRHHHEVD